jgi:membrane fusion protein (multidrug efflux system)
MSTLALSDPKAPAARPASVKARLPAKRLVLGAALIALVFGGGAYGRYWWETGRFMEATDDAYVGGDVTVIAPKVAGFIAEVAVDDNQLVRAGDLLVRLDDRDYRAALARADATVAAQEATLANLDAARRLQDATIAQAQAETGATDAETARTRFDFDRYKQLSSSRYASEQRFQQADADYKKAVAGGQKARAALDAAQRQLDVIDTQKRQARAALAQAEADRDIARLNLGYTEIRAPIDGVIGNRSARTGAYATIGTGMISLVPADGLWVDANFKESQVGAMRPGQTVDIVADVLPGETLHGHVVSLAPATGAQFSVLPPENATGNFTKIVQRVPVRIRLDGEAAKLGRLRPGLSVTAEVDRRGESDTAARPVRVGAAETKAR